MSQPPPTPTSDAAVPGAVAIATAVPTEAFVAVGASLVESTQEVQAAEGQNTDKSDSPADPMSAWGTVEEQEAGIRDMVRGKSEATAKENFKMTDQLMDAIASARKNPEYTLQPSKPPRRPKFRRRNNCALRGGARGSRPGADGRYPPSKK